jgi:hypothetical protein
VLWNALDLCAVGPAVGDRRSRSIRSPSSRLQCQRRNGAWFNSASVHVAAFGSIDIYFRFLFKIQIQQVEGGKSKRKISSKTTPKLSNKGVQCVPQTQNLKKSWSESWFVDQNKSNIRSRPVPLCYHRLTSSSQSTGPVRPGAEQIH